MDEIIGGETTYVGEAHRWARGLRVKIVAVHKNRNQPGANADDAGECPVIRDNGELAAVGGVAGYDLVEFTPWVAEAGRYSGVTSEASPRELERFDVLR